LKKVGKKKGYRWPFQRETSSLRSGKIRAGGSSGRGGASNVREKGKKNVLELQQERKEQEKKGREKEAVRNPSDARREKRGRGHSRQDGEGRGEKEERSLWHKRRQFVVRKEAKKKSQKGDSERLKEGKRSSHKLSRKEKRELVG